MIEVTKFFSRKLNIKNIIQFLKDIYYSGKFVELVSFIVWEIKYKLKLFPRERILAFKNEKSFVFLSTINQLLLTNSIPFEIEKCKKNWSWVIFDSKEFLWASVFENYNLYCYSSDGRLRETYVFNSKIDGIYKNSNDTIFCCCNGGLYRYMSKNNDFQLVLSLSDERNKILKEAFSELENGDLLLGEYGNICENRIWKFVGYVYYSSDDGLTWEKSGFLKSQGINKHIHIIKQSNLINGLIMCDGDNQKNIWVNKSEKIFEVSKNSKSGWKKINKYHINKGGYTGVVETKNKLIFGTDYNGGTNSLISTTNMIEFEEKIIPDPYRRAYFLRIVKNKTSSSAKNEIWATTLFKHSSKVKSLLMMSNDNGDSWYKVIEFDGSRFELNIINDATNDLDKLYFTVFDKKLNMKNTFNIHSCTFN